MSVELRDYQIDAITAIWNEINRKSTALCVLSTGAGKCFGRDTNILMFDGSRKKVQDIKLDDLIMGPDSCPRRVISTNKGIGPLYKITPVKGDPWICNDAHILSLKHTVSGDICNISVMDYLNKNSNFKHVHKIYRTGVSFSISEELDFDPYFLGVWISDGDFLHPSITIGDHKPGVKKFLIEKSVLFGLKTMERRKGDTKCSTISFSMINKAKTKWGEHQNKLKKIIQECTLSGEKRIPKRFLTSSEENRKLLFAAILDTDSHLSNGGFDWITKYKGLSDDICFLARSLGFAAYMSESEKGIKRTGFKGNYFRVSISGDFSELPLLHNKVGKRKQKKSVLRTGFNISPVGDGEYFGFQICGKDNLFLLGDFTVAHNSIIIYELLRKSIASKPDIKCLVLFNRVTLLSQLAERFKKALGEETCGIYCGTEGEWDLSRPVTVGSIQSLDPDHLNFNLIIVDEAHGINDEEGRYERFIRHQMQQNGKTKVVGFTATPFRSNGLIYGKGKLFSEPCYQRGLRYFIDRGFLVPPIAKQPDHQIDVSKLRVLRGEYRQDDIDAQTLNVKMAQDQISDALNRSIGRCKLVWFCASINHAELVKTLLIGAGENAVTIHSKMEWPDRDISLKSFLEGEARHLVNVSVVTEGFDAPMTDCIVLMRPTKSPVVMVQSCGRGLRLYPEKESCLILDYGNVISTLGPLEDPVILKKGKGKGLQEPPQKTCPDCRTYLPPRAMSCPECGFNWPRAEATKLMMTPDEEASFMKKKIHEMEVQNVRMSLHTSKNGNECIKISYSPKGFFNLDVDEYFALDTDWGYRKFVIRAIDLGIKLDTDKLVQSQEKITRMPLKIEYQFESKYPKVKRLVFA